jgi:uncharacterized caspase-like protein
MPNQFDKGRALVVGIADYLHVNKLPNNVLDDARDVADLLRASDYCGYPNANVEILLDGQSTLEGIRKALARLVQSASDEDTVVVFFSGHGARVTHGPDAGEYLLPVDGDLNNPSGTLASSARASFIRAFPLRQPIAAGVCSLRIDQRPFLHHRGEVLADVA